MSALATDSHRHVLPAGALVAALCIVGLLFSAASATAATRFAKPGGTGSAPCEESDPCSLFTAASLEAPVPARAGDVVVLLAGTYSGAADLGALALALPAGINLHGVAGQPRPLIATSNRITVDPGDTVSDLAIESSGAVGLALERGFVDEVTVRDSAAGSVACSLHGGRLVDSACLDSGSNGKAIKDELANVIATVTLRNLTAIATGPGSVGLLVRMTAGAQATIDARAAIVEGELKDVQAEAEGAGSSTTIGLENSDYDNVGVTQFGTAVASVTPAGSGKNIITPPLLAADGVHELAGSATVDAGATDSSSGATDIDGASRSVGRAPDIGADELSLPTATAVSCAPARLALGVGAADCIATVTDTDPAPLSGVVRFASDGQGAFSGGGGCTLVPLKAGSAGCHLSYTPSALGGGTHKITVTYLGDDASHSQSQGSALVKVSAVAPNTRLKKKPRRRTASRLARFSFTSNQPGSTFQCKLDKKPFRSCRSPFKARVKPGRHSFRVRALNRAGGLDLTPAVFKWKVL
jgi:hypothetical protein